MSKLTPMQYYALNFYYSALSGYLLQPNQPRFIACACIDPISSTKTIANASTCPIRIPETFKAALDLQQLDSPARMVQKNSKYWGIMVEILGGCGGASEPLHCFRLLYVTPENIFQSVPCTRTPYIHA